jgi:hypothetical protein
MAAAVDGADGGDEAVVDADVASEGFGWPVPSTICPPRITRSCAMW